MRVGESSMPSVLAPFGQSVPLVDRRARVALDMDRPCRPSRRRAVHSPPRRTGTRWVPIVSACSSRGRRFFDVVLFAPSAYGLCPANCLASVQSRRKPSARETMLLLSFFVVAGPRVGFAHRREDGATPSPCATPQAARCLSQWRVRRLTRENHGRHGAPRTGGDASSCATSRVRRISSFSVTHRSPRPISFPPSLAPKIKYASPTRRPRTWSP